MQDTRASLGNPWGSEIRFGVVTSGQSGGDVVLAGESAEDLRPADPVLGEVDRFRVAEYGVRLQNSPRVL
jgi:hypothetical protein